MKEFLSRREVLLLGASIVLAACSSVKEPTSTTTNNKTSYLYLPFKESELVRSPENYAIYDITEGWTYSDFEHSVHGFRTHSGVDLAVDYGTRVYAPCDGFAMSSYATRWLYNADGKIRTYQGKPMRFGLGYFVQIYNPDENRYVILGHLSDTPKNMPFSMPAQEKNDWVPTNQTVPIKQMSSHPFMTKVKRGDLIGYVGYSGIGWGYEDYFEGSKRPNAIDPEKQKNWDEPHVHFEEYFLNLRTGSREDRRCVYGLYKDYTSYPTPKRRGYLGQDALLVKSRSGWPAFAA